jgi:hypothetical protein
LRSADLSKVSPSGEAPSPRFVNERKVSQIEKYTIVRASNGVLTHWARDSHGEGRVVIDSDTEEGSDLLLSLDESDLDDLIEEATALNAARQG